MKYYVANFKIEGAGNTEVCRDIIASLAAEAGFESFEENGDGLNGYVQQELLDEPMLKSLQMARHHSSSRMRTVKISSTPSQTSATVKGLRMDI